MASSEPAPAAPRRIRLRRTRVAGLLIVVVAIAAAVGSHSRMSSPSTASSRSTADVPRHEPRGALGAADGAVPDGVTVFDDAIPGVAKLDPALLGALRQAATDAQGVAFVVDSGWRSPEYQERLLQEAISEYGSAQEAARWVASPETSAHVSGDAIDLGRAAAAWLSEHGATYGLCRVYGNESWHYELRPEAVDHGCPPTYADPTQDPRMQR
ncbi:MAG: peptidase and DD-carboxypeptidase VanY/endolysin [Microbacteriaceae bacterium]|nr:peptidase and DD-carboxypeptidase VanY/endolysin [Microbacteriaceae bacterium]